MSDNEYILSLYNRLEVRGSKSKAVREIAKRCDRTPGTVKNHWLLNQDFPEEHHSTIINYLEEQVKEHA